MFKSEEEIKKIEEDKKQMKEEFEEERTRHFKEEALRNQIESKYDKMISDLKSGKVHPDTYQKEESLNFSPDEIADLSESKAFHSLWDKKYQLAAARQEASSKWIRMTALEKVLEKKVDPINFERLEQSLSGDLLREYVERIGTEMESQTEPEKDKDSEPKSEKPKEPEEEEEGDYSTERNVEYQL